MKRYVFCLVLLLGAGAARAWDEPFTGGSSGVGGSGSVTSVATGQGLTGGTITSTGTLSIPSGNLPSTVIASSVAASAVGLPQLSQTNTPTANDIATAGAGLNSITWSTPLTNVMQTTSTDTVTAPKTFTTSTVTIQTGNITSTPLIVSTGSATYGLVVSTNNKVGIGTNNPTKTLDVNGTSNFSSTMTITAGTGTGAYTPTGTMTTLIVSSATPASTAETTLFTYSLPANTLVTTGKTIRIFGEGTTAANANTKDLRAYFGATVCSDSGVVALNNGAWRISCEVMTIGATAQDSYGVFLSNAVISTHTAPAETPSGAITIKITGQNGTASANDIVLKTASVEFKP